MPGAKTNVPSTEDNEKVCDEGLDAEQHGAEAEELEQEGRAEEGERCEMLRFASTTTAERVALTTRSRTSAEMALPSMSKSSGRLAKASRGVSFGVKIAESSVIDESAVATPARSIVKVSEEAHMPPTTPLRGVLKVGGSVASEQSGYWQSVDCPSPKSGKSDDRFGLYSKSGERHGAHSPIPSPLRGVGNASPLASPSPLRGDTAGNLSLVTSTSPFAAAFSNRAQSVAERWLSRKKGVESCMGAVDMGSSTSTRQRKLISQDRQLRRLKSISEPQAPSPSYVSGVWREVTRALVPLVHLLHCAQPCPT